ncbi:hypothetical protein C8Q80DRAFT_1167581 [Daedaleopsis nitida]|nr:hypothetical protein C8Q80DRAFT_1167581 [Daedaleopsis nitida]
MATAAADLPSIPRDLHGCSHCGKDQSELQEPLKRCARCAAVVYCSKACQRSAWPSHKILCREQISDSEAQLYRELGYESAMDLVKAFNQWENTHYYSMAVIANCAVYKQGGVEHNLDSPGALLIGLKSRPDLRDDNPSMAFCVEYSKLVDGPVDDFTRAHWERMVSEREKQEAHIEKVWPELNFAGCIPTLTIIDAPTGHYPIIGNYPIFHRLRSEEDDSLTDSIFTDIAFMCSLCILLGYIFHPPREAGQVEPYVEQNVRTRKGWKPRPADEKCWDVLSGPRNRPTPAYVTGWSARALWTRFKELSGICERSEVIMAILRGD